MDKSALIPSLSAEMQKVIDALGLVGAAYKRGLIEGALFATVALLVAYVLSRKS